MATETLYGNSYTTVSGITGSSNWLGAPNGAFYGAPNANTSWSARFQFPTPTNPTFASGTQRWSAYVRKGSNSGNPTVTLNLYKDGSLVSSHGPISIISTSTTKVILQSALWTGQSTSGYELEVVTTAAGGSPSARNGVELDAVEALLETAAPVPNTPPVALVRQVHTDPIRYTGTAQYSADQSYDTDGTIAAYKWAEDLSAGSQPGSVIWYGLTTNVNVSFGVTAPGTYNMQLTVTDDDGAVDTEKFTTTFTPNQAPVLVHDSPYSATVGSPITIDLSGSYDPDGNIVSYHIVGYDFSDPPNPDGTIPQGTGPTWTFTPTSQGQYAFLISATDNEGAQDDDVIYVSVSPAPNQDPVVVSDSPYSTTVGQPVDIDISASYDPDGTIVDYYLNPYASNPDLTGLTGTGPVWTFTPTTTGTYTFMAGVFDNDGGEADQTIIVNVSPGTTPTVTKYLYDGANLIPLGVTIIAT